MLLAPALLTIALLLPFDQVPQSAPQVPAPQTPPLVAEAPATAAVPDPATEIVCRNEIATGRRVPKRVCRSRAQMQIEEAAGREALRRAQENHRRTIEE